MSSTTSPQRIKTVAWVAALGLALLCHSALLAAEPGISANKPDANGEPGIGNNNTGEPGQEFGVQIYGPKRVYDGQPATFKAVTEPPGHEHEVEWSAITKFGQAEPASGVGATFTVVFHETLGGPQRHCQWLAVRAEGAEFKQVGEDDCIEDLFIPKGEDCWNTPDCDTVAAFCEDPLPPDFFDAGSKVWKGKIPLKGPEGEEYDTILERKNDILLPGWDAGTSDIELTQLLLEGCETITVEYEDGYEETWEVKVEKSDLPPDELGEITIDRQFDNGGSFEATFPVHVKYIFTDVDDPDRTRELDTAAAGLDPISLRTLGDAPWVAAITDPDIEDKYCGVNFKPGIREHSLMGGRRQCCCKPTGHSSGKKGHLHKTGETTYTCPDGACLDPSDLSCDVVLPASCPSSHLFMGAGTDCKDSDGDGIPDGFEGNDCCATGVVGGPFLTMSDPFNPDTDGDGISDGDEFLGGTDACNPYDP